LDTTLIVITLTAWGLCAAFTATVFHSKGRAWEAGAVVGLLLGAIGLAIALCLSEVPRGPQPKSALPDDASSLERWNEWSTRH
jgi:hypothetical protein